MVVAVHTFNPGLRRQRQVRFKIPRLGAGGRTMNTVPEKSARQRETDTL